MPDLGLVTVSNDDLRKLLRFVLRKQVVVAALAEREATDEQRMRRLLRQ